MQENNTQKKSAFSEAKLSQTENYRWQTCIYTAILAVAACMAMCVHFFPSYDMAFVLCPWIYLPCFLYISRHMHGKIQYFLWLFFWCGSFMIRYWDFLSAFNRSVSIVLTFVASIVYLLPFAIDHMVYMKGPRAVSWLMFPFACAAIDYALELTSLGSLFSMATTQFDNKPLLQLASIFGNKGIVFVLALTASLLVYHRRNPKKFILCLAAVALLHLCGFLRIYPERPAIDSSEKISIGWSAEPVKDDSFFVADSDGSLAYNVECLKLALEEAKAMDLQLLCFPEESFYLYSNKHDEFLENAQALAKEYGINLLLSVEAGDYLTEDNKVIESVSDIEDSSSPILDVSLNHCVFINAEGEIDSDYVKSILIPVAEKPYYLEGDSVLPRVSAKLDGQDLILSYAICFDGDFASYIRTSPNDTSLFIDVSWDWDAIDEFHYRIIGMRAVENGFTVVKPTINGYTTVTDYLGKVWSKTHADETGYQGVNKVTLPIAKTETIYHKAGNLIDQLYIIGVVLLFIIFLLGGNYKWKRKNH